MLHLSNDEIKVKSTFTLQVSPNIKEKLWVNHIFHLFLNFLIIRRAKWFNCGYQKLWASDLTASKSNASFDNTVSQ